MARSRSALYLLYIREERAKTAGQAVLAHHALLHELLEQYKKDPNPLNQEKSLLPPPKKSKKEETLSEAASLLEENIYSQKQISQLTASN